jgi:hypothetical protein
MTVTYGISSPLNTGVYLQTLGIGTTAPRYSLDVEGDVRAANLSVIGDTGNHVDLVTDSLYYNTLAPVSGYNFYTFYLDLMINEVETSIVTNTSNLEVPSITDVPIQVKNIKHPDFYAIEVFFQAATPSSAFSPYIIAKAVSIKAGLNLLFLRVDGYNGTAGGTNNYTLAYSTNGGATYVNVMNFPVICDTANQWFMGSVTHPVNWLNDFTTTHWRITNSGYWNLSGKVDLCIVKLPFLTDTFTMPPQA